MDTEIKERTAQDLNCSIEDVERAIRIYKTYSKFKGQEKQKRKREKERSTEVFVLQQLKDAHPEQCFCDEDGIEVERSRDTDEIIRYEERYRRSIVGELVGPTYQEPIYRCPHCGKEYIYKIAIAS